MVKTIQASLYFHIPFCKKKCPYCHFYVIPNKAQDRALLSEGFALEWERQKGLLQGTSIVSIYFGGGTPSLMEVEQIGAVIRRCGSLAPDCEITLEANPEDGEPELFAALREVGINRVSFGVQSLDDRALGELGRAHTGARAKSAIQAAYLAGIKNISIDLMYDLPDQTESSWHYTLDQIQDLPIQHLSLYNLTIEPHPSFYRRKNELRLPSQEVSLRLLSDALVKFEQLGFERYEISAFARPGFESRHNTGYWTFRPFLGFGPSAFSYWNGERLQNTPNLQRYVRALRGGESPVHFRETLAFPENLREQIAVGLRLKRGCMLPENTPERTLETLRALQDRGLVELRGPNIRLTERGQFFYDTVATEII